MEKPTAGGRPLGRLAERREMTIPVYMEEGTVLRMSMGVLDLKDSEGQEKADVTTGAGCGSDHVTFTWRDDQEVEHRGTIHLGELLGLFVQMVEPDASPVKVLQPREIPGRACPTCGREDVPLEELRSYGDGGSLRETGCTACTQEKAKA